MLVSWQYRAFVPNELIRIGIILDVFRRGGYVWANQLVGRHLYCAGAEKAAKEFKEVKYAHTLEDIKQECADVMEVMLLLRSRLHVRHSIVRTYQNINAMASAWENAAQWFKQVGSDDAEDMHYRMTALVLETQALLSNTLDMPTLMRAVKAKRKAKGPLETWYVNVVALRREDEFCKAFAAKCPEIPPQILDISMATPPRRFAVTSG